jgi:uncharacterized membrane protein YphA (DoxX/SURF4 family)
VIPLLPADLVAWIARDALGLTFLLSASGKLRNVDALVIGVLRYEIGPPVLMRRLAPLLPLGELLLAALLVTGIAVRATALATGLLVAVLAVAVIVNLRRDRPIPCHCFGNEPSERIGPVTVVRLLLLAAAAWFVAIRAPAAGGVLPPTESLADALRLSGIAIYAAGALRLMGPVDVLVRDVINTRRRRRQAVPSPWSGEPPSPGPGVAPTRPFLAGTGDGRA